MNRTKQPVVEIRPANATDLPKLVRIYNHYVVQSHVTFDIEPYTLEARLEWFAAFAEKGPCRLLVAERDGEVVGYASSTRFRSRPAYYRSVETTIYLEEGRAVGAGTGRRLYASLLAELVEEPAVHRAYGGIALPNPASIALHERLGFRRVGTLREVGHKFEKFWDVAWFEKEL